MQMQRRVLSSMSAGSMRRSISGKRRVRSAGRKTTIAINSSSPFLSLPLCSSSLLVCQRGACSHSHSDHSQCTNHQHSHDSSNNTNNNSSSNGINNCTKASRKSRNHPPLGPDCWSCGNKRETSLDELFCSLCGKIQSMKKDKNEKFSGPCYFDLLDQPKEVQINENSLEGSYRQLQKVLHPDKYANATKEERELSLENSSVVNQAYETLRRPEDRVSYLLSTKFGISSLDDETTSFDSSVMADMFELREEIEDLNSEQANDEASIKEREDKRLALVESVEKQIADIMPSLQEQIDNDNLDKAISLAVRLKYLTKAKSELLK